VQRRRQIGRTLGWANLAQWLAILLVAVVCNHLGRVDLIVPLVTGVVGFHLFPLGRVLRSSLHIVTGIAFLAWAAACLLGLPAGRWPSTGALGTGCILWAAAAATLARTRELPAAARRAARGQEALRTKE